jgi:hypothetical protein
MAGYSGRPLLTKLGIKPNHRLLFVNAAKPFDTQLGALPEASSSTANQAKGSMT